MLKFFFNRSSPVVLLMNTFAGLEILLLVYRHWQGHLSIWPATAFLMVSWGMLNFLNLFPWYPQKVDLAGRPEKLGIRLHFHQTMVPYIYLMAVAFLLKLLGVSEWLMAVPGVLVLPLYYVNAILLYFHFRDSSTLTPGYFSHNFYRKDEDPACTP